MNVTPAFYSTTVSLFGTRILLIETDSSCAHSSYSLFSFLFMTDSSLTEPEINIAIVQQLAEMGFPWEACRKAVHFTGNTGSEAAMNWVMEHMGDADFAEPLIVQNKTSSNCL